MSVAITEDAGSASTECGLFPYTVIDFDINEFGIGALVTENGKVFVWGHTFFTEPTGYDLIGAQSKIRSPVRMDLPVGVKGVKVTVSGGHGIVLADDGNMYAWGVRPNVGQNGDPFASTTGINKNTLTLMDLPAGVTSVVDAEAGGYAPVYSFMIGDNGNTYWTGQNPDYGLEVAIWTQVPNPGVGITYTKIYTVDWESVDADNEDLIETVYLKGSDGNYYSFGSNIWRPIGFVGRQWYPRQYIFKFQYDNGLQCCSIINGLSSRNQYQIFW